jgi:dephospho-CoA kinase
MLQVGITGGIGAGKSLVCRIFEALGVPVYDADSRAKWVMAYDSVLVSHIMEEFGREAYTSGGEINRAYMAQTVFHNPERLAKLNALVHPRVGVDYRQWLQAHQQAPYVLKEAALLFETGSYKQLDFIIVVDAPLEVRVKRVLLRDPHRDDAQVRAIIQKQMPEQESKAKTDFVIDNSGEQLLIPQVLKLHEFFLAQKELKS